MDHEYTQRLEKIEAVLQAWLPEQPGPEQSPWMTALFSDLPGEAPPGWAGSLTRPGWDLLRRGGKRWRPLLMTLLCESLGGGDQALPLVPLVEFPHNASLIHDDIEDNSDERRGEPAIHLRYGADTAINGGSFLYFLPLSCMESWDAPENLKYQVLNLWALQLRRLHLGQALDIQWHRDFSSLPSLESYRLMCRLKTGSLSRLAASLGVVAASRVSPELTKKESGIMKTLGEAAEKLGMGFQILDDVRNLTTGNPGKKRGDDVVEGKKSLPVLLYLHRRQDKRDWAGRCFSQARLQGTAAPEVEEFIEELTAAGVIQEAAAQGREAIAQAQEIFSRQGGGGLLSGLLDFIGGAPPHAQEEAHG